MVWDLGKAMQKKEEFESARLMDFEFRQRVRTARLLAREAELDETELVRDIAGLNVDRIVNLVAQRTGCTVAEDSADYGRLTAQARQQLIAERGDPTPYRLG